MYNKTIKLVIHLSIQFNTPEYIKDFGVKWIKYANKCKRKLKKSNKRLGIQPASYTVKLFSLQGATVPSKHFSIQDIVDLDIKDMYFGCVIVPPINEETDHNA